MASIYSISALGSSNNSSSSKTSNLSEETIRKLEALGIDVDSVSSETEAKKLIAEEEAKKSSSVEGEENNTMSEEETLFNEIKNLAQKLGITVSENDNIEDIFSKIESKLESLKENSYNSNINVFQSEYEMLKRQFENMNSGESSILSAMDMISMSNRAALGI